MELNQIIHGDCLQKMKEIPDNSIDLISTDPPYAMVSGSYSENKNHKVGFMGKKWDSKLPPVEVWKECFRVLKPGGFAFVMSAVRQDLIWRMMRRLEKAEFNIGFSSIYWTYANGFPKGQNISKSIDNRMGMKGEKIGSKKVGRKNGACGGSHSSGFNENEVDVYEPLSSEAKRFRGAYGGYQPRPALECIIVAMKSLSEKTFIDQALKNGKGVSWLGDCYIPVNDNIPSFSRSPTADHTVGISRKHIVSGGGTGIGECIKGHVYVPSDKGRFPANLIVSDSVLDDGKIRKVKKNTKDIGIPLDTREMGWGFRKVPQLLEDEGDFSRYFDLDAWFMRFVNDLPSNVRNTFPFLVVPKPSSSEKNLGLTSNPIDNSDYYNGKFPESKGDRENINKHPCVKPLKLFVYMITLGSRPGDTILDPYVGAGTCALAAKITGRNYIGIELEEEHVKLARERISAPSSSKLIKAIRNEGIITRKLF